MKPYSRVCWFLLLLYLCLGFTDARADSWYVRCGEYSSADGHGLSVKTYRAYFDLDGHYKTEDACDAVALKWPDKFYHGAVLRDQSQALAECWCERVRA